MTRLRVQAAVAMLGLALIGGPLVIGTTPAHAQLRGVESYIDQELKSNRACQKIYDVNIRESDARRAQLDRIPDDDYAALCRYGRKVGYPGMLRAVNRFRQSKTCNTRDPVIAAVISVTTRNAEQNREAVERDCARAGL